MLRRRPAAAACIAGVACAWLAALAHAESPSAEPPTALVIAVMGDEMDLQRVGTTIFQNKSARVDVSPWLVPDRIEISVAEVLTTSGRMRAAPANDIEIRALLAGMNASSSRLFFNSPKFREALRTIGQDRQLNYLVILSGAHMQDVFYRTNQRLHDYGIIERSIIGQPRSAQLYATISIELRDATTGGLLERQNARFAEPRGPMRDDLSLTTEELQAMEPRIHRMLALAANQAVGRLEMRRAPASQPPSPVQ